MMENSSLETVTLGQEPEVIISVRNAYKRYTPTAIVLQDLNMTVNKGSIYGLLGPSGCGKTTLLSALVGRKVLDSGSIKVGLEEKKQLGYMPQEISLFEELSIAEIFLYFGYLMNRSTEYILKRQTELIEFLELPSPDRIVGALSGGQQRRVSMAVAFLHDPELLILDEPTVGLDPVLCHNIWNFFMKITNEDRKTIVITTHYIEEAKNSDRIGLMRGGIILAEMSPLELITSLNCSSLEEAFLKLSEKQENEQTELTEYPNTKPEKSDIPFQNGEMFTGYRFKAQFYKNYSWTKRNLPVTTFILFLPSVLFVIFMLMLGGNLESINLATVRHELTPGSDDCVNINKITSEYGCVTDRRLSCLYISYLENKSYNVIEYNKTEDGIDSVKRNEAFALLYFPRNYTEALLDRLDKGRRSTNETLEESSVQIYMDNTVFYLAVTLRSNLVNGYISFMQNVLKNCGIEKAVIELPIREEEPVYEGLDVRYSPLSGYTLSILFYLAYVYTSTSLAYERNTGIVERASVGGLTNFELAGAHFCAQTVVCLLQNSNVFIILYLVFKISTNGNIFQSCLLYLLLEYCGMGFGFMVVQFTTVDFAVTYIGVCIVISLFFSIGMMWPVEGMHWTLKYLNTGNPVKKALDSYTSQQFRKLPFSHPLVYEGYLYATAFLLGICIICVKQMRNN